MKKLSVLVALMLIITVGGVYATWNYTYATGSVNPVSNLPITVKLDDKVMSGENSSTRKGTISIISNDVSLVIDQKDSNYNPKWVTDGAITGTFTPDDNATDAVKTNGIPMYFELSCTNLPGGLYITNGTGLIEGGNATKDWSIDAATIASMITFNITLDTPAEYDAFETALGNAEFTITIFEGPAGPPEGFDPEDPI